MATVVFAFTYDTETKNGTFVGNCDPIQSLNILQSLIVANAIKMQQMQAGQDKKLPTKGVKKPR